ncbi:MAG: hypothetical protein KAY65_07975, partial [Planctomycetes bacterium]|nr:hypothetical protein [Planctomycetota bacterium]
ERSEAAPRISAVNEKSGLVSAILAAKATGTLRRPILTYELDVTRVSGHNTMTHKGSDGALDDRGSTAAAGLSV